MKKEIGKIRYNLKMSKRAKLMRLEVHRNGELVVTVPRGIDDNVVERFILQKAGWIRDKLEYIASIKDPSSRAKHTTGQGKIFLNGSKREYQKYKEAARELAHRRIFHFNQLYNFNVHNIAIKNQKSRWGSCSKKGNLNFNYKIALLSQELADYVIVHELCHLGEFNHSKRFWKLVSLTVPNYNGLRLSFK